MTVNIDTTNFIPDEVAMLGRRYVKQWQSSVLNTQTFQAWYDFLRTAAITSFKWEGLPDCIDHRFVEWAIFTYGMGAFFKASSIPELPDYMFGQCAPRGKWNIYYNPRVVDIYAPNDGTRWTRHPEPWSEFVGTNGNEPQFVLRDPDAVVVFDNVLRKTITPMLMLYARRLADIDRTIDINLKAQKTPYLITCPEEMRRDARNYFNQIDGNEPVIYTNVAAADLIGISAVETLAPYVADKLLVDQAKIVNTVYTMLGIDNSNTEKRERMIDAEATSNNEQIIAQRLGRMNPRREAAKKLSEMWGTEITVKWAIPHKLDAGEVDVEGSDDFDGLLNHDDGRLDGIRAEVD